MYDDDDDDFIDEQIDDESLYHDADPQTFCWGCGEVGCDDPEHEPFWTTTEVLDP